MFLDGFSYFSEFWNNFDLLRSVFLVYYTWDYLTSDKKEEDIQEQFRYLLAILVFLSYFRALSFLRLFQKTRVFIRLLVETTSDMIPFMVVLISSMIGFSLTYQTMTGSPVIQSLQYNYRLMFGDFQIEDEVSDIWILFVVASTLMPLIMLNMLIAIMSDTYARVMAEIVPSDFYEINQLILEVEEVQVWKRSSGTPMILHFAEYI